MKKLTKFVILFLAILVIVAIGFILLQLIPYGKNHTNPAVVLEPANAALLAAKILGCGDEDVRRQVLAKQKEQAGKILKDDEEIQAG